MSKGEAFHGVTITDEGAVAVLSLQNSARRNAMSLQMREQLIERLRDAMCSSQYRAIVITGSDGHFCAGGDMRSAEIDNGPEPLRTSGNALPLQEIVRLIATGPKPVVAAVEGAAAGAGFSLAAACDIVVASESAKFCASFSKVGLMPDMGILWSLPRRVGSSKANHILLTATNVLAEEALRIGLVDEIAAEGAALQAAIERAQALTKIAPLSLAATKSVMSRSQELEAVLAAERQIQPLLTLSDDYLEGRSAFINRRLPEFSGK